MAKPKIVVTCSGIKREYAADGWRLSKGGDLEIWKFRTRGRATNSPKSTLAMFHADTWDWVEMIDRSLADEEHPRRARTGSEDCVVQMKAGRRAP